MPFISSKAGRRGFMEGSYWTNPMESYLEEGESQGCRRRVPAGTSSRGRWRIRCMEGVTGKLNLKVGGDMVVRTFIELGCWD
jgi:hypothetical protein